MTTNQPQISVIIPIYNVDQYIAQCLEALIGQTLKNIEIICVDDRGTDNSINIVKEYAKKDKRIKIITHNRNRGLSASRNTGIQNSTAPYIMFCDSDDFYQPDMCEKMLMGIEKSGADMAMCGTNIIYEVDEKLKESDNEYYKIKFSGLTNVSEDVINQCDVSSWNKIFKRTLFDKYAIQFPEGLKYEDAFFFRAYAIWAKTIFFINDKLYNYRRRGGSIMNETFKKNSFIAIDHLKIAITFFDYLNKHNLYVSKYAYFWKSVFIPYFYFALWNTHGRNAIRKIFGLAAPFVSINYKGDLDFSTNRTLDMIVNKTLNQTKKYLCGIIAIKETEDKKVVRVCAVPIFKIKFFEWGTKYYLAGVQVCLKYF